MHAKPCSYNSPTLTQNKILSDGVLKSIPQSDDADNVSRWQTYQWISLITKLRIKNVLFIVNDYL